MATDFANDPVSTATTTTAGQMSAADKAKTDAAALADFAQKNADSELAGPAMYQAGLAYARAGKPDQAAKMLANFTERFPKHEQAGGAMLAQANQRTQTVLQLLQ